LPAIVPSNPDELGKEPVKLAIGNPFAPPDRAPRRNKPVRLGCKLQLGINTFESTYPDAAINCGPAVRWSMSTATFWASIQLSYHAQAAP
jgi:hypothetical protein